MKKIILLITLLSLAAFIAVYFINHSSGHTQSFPDAEADLIFFWGEGCPHCQKVEDYIKDNQLDSKLKISKKEVYRDTNNQQLLQETVQKCPEIDTSKGIGVPLAFDPKTNQCLYGDTPIIEWLKSK